MIDPSKHKPPALARHFLELYCSEEYLEEIHGDILELFELRLTQEGKRKARLMYVWDVLRFFRWSNLKTTKKVHSNFITMTRNNFKIAARILWRQKVNTAMNTLGIAIGIVCFLLISLYVKQELTFDTFHEKKDRIYRAWVKELYDDGRVFFNTNTPVGLGPALIDNLPEVEAYVHFDNTPTLVGRGDARIAERLDYASSNFFEVFDFKVLRGNVNAPLGNFTDIVLSESYAQKYFGNGEAVGKTMAIQLNGEIRDFVVSAVVEDAPLNTGLQYNMIISADNIDLLYGGQRALNRWFNISPETYIIFKEPLNTDDLEPKTRAMVKSLLAGAGAFGADAIIEDHYVIGFQPLTDIHLNTEVPQAIAPVGNPDYVYILGAIGLLVMVIACINYTTLSIGQSFKRSKEVGVRKVVGARGKGLIWQYLSESVLVSFLSMIIGVVLTFMLLPVFNDLAQTSLEVPKDLGGLGFAIVLALSIGLLSGVYPALVLSRFKAVDVLKGSGQGTRSKQLARRGMVVFQFLLTVFLISSTLIMRKQMQYIQNQDLGYEYDAMVSVPLYPRPDVRPMSQRISTAMDNGRLLIGELEKNTQLSDFGMATHMFGTPGWVQLGFTATNGNYLQFNLLVTDAEYLPAMGIRMAEGRTFDPKLESDKLRGVILNKAAAEYFGLENPIGAKLPGDGFEEHQIIGVTEDFNFQSLHSEVRPLVIVQDPRPIFPGISDFNAGDSAIPKLAFRYKGSKLSEVKDILEPTWAQLFPAEELNFNFLEERLNAQYQSEARVNKIVSIATLLSILIASLGLLGLTVLVVNTKVKEIGIRKVLGASPKLIFKLLFKGFSLQLLLAVVLSVPITWYLMTGWLSDFAYQVSIGIDMFLLSGVLALIIMLLVVSYHVLRASRANPVKALRTE